MSISIEKNKIGKTNYVVIEKIGNNIIAQHRAKNKIIAKKIKNQIIKQHKIDKRILGKRNY